MERLKILAVAYACSPMRGSEFGVGWGWVSSIAKNHNVTVITADFNQGEIESYLRTQESSHLPALKFIYVKNRPWHYRPEKIWLGIENSIAKPLMNFAYQDWLRCAFQDAKQETATSNYDLIHLITYVGWRFPGKFYQLGIPFVWGPIGGLKNTPWRLLPILGVKGAVYYGGRNLVNSIQLRTLQGPKRALRFANGGVIAATSEIQQELKTHFQVESRVICEVGPPNLVVAKPTQRGENEPFNICWSGQHLPGKALHLLLQAVARLSSNIKYKVEILGDGPQNRAWRDMASQLDIEDYCHWHGWLPRDQCLEVMRRSHVFVITSLKDLTSTVAVEALSLGLPIISLNHCGFADLVTKECGIKVNLSSSLQMITGLANSLLRLYHDEALRMHLAKGALNRSDDYGWPSKMASLNEIYMRCLAPTRGIAKHAQSELPATIHAGL
jgi:glycosyltransferase involved in cell wall biosynthesis